MAFTVVGKSPVPALVELWVDYCADRGLTPDMLGVMKGELLTLDLITRGSYGFGTSIFAMKQYGALGAFVFPLDEGEYQARLIYDPNFVKDVDKPGDTVKARKGHKYSRPPGSSNLLYIPPHITDWFNPEVKYTLLIVEGALNAVRLASAGYHAVAIQGVSNYKIQGKTSPVIPQLVRLVESKQVEKVIYVPDSDTGDIDNKPALVHAVNTFCLDLMRIRPNRQDTVFVCRPPAEPDGSKNGPDDYLNKKGIDEFNRMLREDSERFSDNKYLQIQKETVLRYIYNESTDEYWDEKLRNFISVGHLNNHLKGYGLVEDILFPRAKPIYYNNDRLRSASGLRVAEGIKYRPDLDDPYFSETDDIGTKWYINKHSPADVPKAIKGDVRLFKQMLASLCRNSPSAIPKIMTILAKHAQEPALTPKYAILFTGDKGAGKSNMAECIGRALSKRYHNARVDPSSDFNDDWVGFACKEWAEFDHRMDAEWLKDLITSKTHRVNGKNKSIYTDGNHTLNLFTCNDLKSKIQEGDRRFVIGGYGKPDNKELGLVFEEWIQGEGPNNLRYHLLYEVDASGYDRIDVHTEMTDEVIGASKSYKASVRDDIIGELNQWPELECVPNDIINKLLIPHDVKLISFLKDFSRDFQVPGRTVVKIDGTSTKFRCFKNFDKWLNPELDTEEYRKQALMATKLTSTNNRKY